MFGAGPDWVQLTWSVLGPGQISVRTGDLEETIDTDGGPGSHVIEGLTPDTDHAIALAGEGLGRRAPIQLRARTLPIPPGEELLRLATVSDVHIGIHTTGFFHTIAEIPTPAVPHTMRCLDAALAEAREWGAEHLVVKGDLVDRSDDDNWRIAGQMLGRVELPIQVLPGNHERSKKGDVEPIAGAAVHGVDLVDRVRSVDHGGVRILLADTTRPGTDFGTLEHVRDDLVEAASTTDGPVLVAVHHQLMRTPVPTYIPPGITSGPARRFLRDLGRANPRSVVTSGHTHRHRRYEHGGVTVTEVGSTKDFPGSWAGYRFFEGGVIQTVRRIGEPSVIRWTDHTRRAALGAWALWSPGPRASRCFTRLW